MHGFIFSFLRFQSCVKAGNSDAERNITTKGEKKGFKLNFSKEKPETPLLDTINYPVHMKRLSITVGFWFYVILLFVLVTFSIGSA